MKSSEIPRRCLLLVFTDSNQTYCHRDTETQRKTKHTMVEDLISLFSSSSVSLCLCGLFPYARASDTSPCRAFLLRCSHACAFSYYKLTTGVRDSVLIS